MAAAILISTFGCVNGLVLAGARVYYAMARDGLFFRSVATTNRFHVPGGRAGRPRASGRLLLVLPVTVDRSKPGTDAVEYGNLYNELLEYIIPVDVTFYTLMVGGGDRCCGSRRPSCRGPIGRSAIRCPSCLHRPGGPARASTSST